jgi:hypothetical protein
MEEKIRNGRNWSALWRIIPTIAVRPFPASPELDRLITDLYPEAKYWMDSKI